MWVVYRPWPGKPLKASYLDTPVSLEVSDRSGHFAILAKSGLNDYVSIGYFDSWECAESELVNLTNALAENETVYHVMGDA